MPEPMPTILNIRPLLAAVKTRLTELLTDQTFAVKGSAEPAAVAIHLYRLPNSARADITEDVCPWCVISQLGGADTLQEGTTRLRLIFGVYNEGVSGEGDYDVERLAAAALRLSLRQDFHPHVLQPGIEFFFGVSENGEQAHPQYFLTVLLTFSREPVYLNE